MTVHARIFANSYRDSVELMRIAAELEAVDRPLKLRELRHEEPAHIAHGPPSGQARGPKEENRKRLPQGRLGLLADGRLAMRIQFG